MERKDPTSKRGCKVNTKVPGRAGVDAAGTTSTYTAHADPKVRTAAPARSRLTPGPPGGHVKQTGARQVAAGPTNADHASSRRVAPAPGKAPVCVGSSLASKRPAVGPPRPRPLGDKAVARAVARAVDRAAPFGKARVPGANPSRLPAAAVSKPSATKPWPSSFNAQRPSQEQSAPTAPEKPAFSTASQGFDRQHRVVAVAPFLRQPNSPPPRPSPSTAQPPTQPPPQLNEVNDVNDSMASHGSPDVTLTLHVSGRDEHDLDEFIRSGSWPSPPRSPPAAPFPETAGALIRSARSRLVSHVRVLDREADRIRAYLEFKANGTIGGRAVPQEPSWLREVSPDRSKVGNSGSL